MRRARVFAICALVILPAVAFTAKAGDGLWLTKVPNEARARANPMAGSPSSIAAGAKLFQQNCASCHGAQGQGSDKRPNLHSERLKSATPGQLEWLLKNGSLKNGLPSWSRLPEPQRWQLVTYLKSLD